jgi:hypothetical protein
MKIISSIIVLLVFNAIPKTTGQKKEMITKNYNGYKLIETLVPMHLLKSISAKYKMVCLAECFQSNECSAIYFNRLKEDCQMYKNINQDNLPSDLTIDTDGIVCIFDCIIFFILCSVTSYYYFI